MKGGTIKLFGIATSTLSPSLPDVPTTIEAVCRLPGFPLMNAVFAPKGNAAGGARQAAGCAREGRDRPGHQEEARGSRRRGADERRASPEALAELVRTENARWVTMLKERVKQ